MVPGQLGSLLARLHRPIRIAVAGHRPNQLPGEARAQVRAALEAAFDAIKAAGVEVAGKHARFVVVSALAEGADRMAAEAALAREWAIECPLPFSIERYEKDFATPESVAEFQALMKRAAKVTPAPANDQNDEAGYASVGDAVSKSAEIGVIVWNGEAAKGKGGTADVASKILESGAPVLWIGVAERQRSKLVLPAEDVAKKGTRALYLRSALAARFEKTERPAEMRTATA
jgi:hypothetical protein